MYIILPVVSNTLYLVSSTEPVQPGVISLVESTTDSLVITWNQSYGLSHYIVDVLPDEGTVDVQPSAGETWAAYITDLLVSGGLYEISVIPYNGEHSGLSQITEQITGEALDTKI